MDDQRGVVTWRDLYAHIKDERDARHDLANRSSKAIAESFLGLDQRLDAVEKFVTETRTIVGLLKWIAGLSAGSLGLSILNILGVFHR